MTSTQDLLAFTLRAGSSDLDLSSGAPIRVRIGRCGASDREPPPCLPSVQGGLAFGGGSRRSLIGS